MGEALLRKDRTHRKTMWVRRSCGRTAHKGERRKEVRWCEGRSGREDRTPLDLLLTVEEARAPSNNYQVQTGHRHRTREKRLLIGIYKMLGVLRVKGHAHWIRIQVVKES